MSERMEALLASIDASLKMLVASKATTGSGGVASAASDKDLDSKYGDPILKTPPRDWSGDSYAGRKYSECPADLLQMVAERSDYFAQKADETGEKTAAGKSVAMYKRLDASRARGWKRRVELGYVPPPKPTFQSADDTFPPPYDSDIPFSVILPLLLTTMAMFGSALG